jgi:hypothetical protein
MLFASIADIKDNSINEFSKRFERDEFLNAKLARQYR